ncbi:MAG: hypothetical protein ACOYLH_02510 [Flavobacteriales bacterium]
MKFTSIIVVKKTLSLLVLILIADAVIGQSSTSNPYSRFGIGILESPGSTVHFGMGGTTTSIADQNSVNLFNPASYSLLGRTVLQLSGKGVSQNLSSTSVTEKFAGGYVNEISLGLKKSGSPWGMVLGVTPYSRVGYNISSNYAVNDSTEASYLYDGYGGTNKLTVGASRSFKLFVSPKADSTLKGNAAFNFEQRRKEIKDSLNLIAPVLSLGINANYYFGTVNLERRIQFENTEYFSTKITQKTTLHDFAFEGGLLYTMPLKVKWDQRKIKKATYLRFGATYQLGTALKSKTDELGMAYFYTNGSESNIDTTYYTGITKGSFDLPSRLSLGLSIIQSEESGKTLTYNLEYRTQDWSNNNVNSTEQSFTLSNYRHFSLGIEFTPMTLDKAENILERTTYRIGARNTESYLTIRGENIGQQALSLGFSIPIVSSKSTSKFNFGVEYGKGGTTNNDLIAEDFIQFQIGFSLTPHILNPWFVVRKYD